MKQTSPLKSRRNNKHWQHDVHSRMSSNSGKDQQEDASGRTSDRTHKVGLLLIVLYSMLLMAAFATKTQAYSLPIPQPGESAIIYDDMDEELEPLKRSSAMHFFKRETDEFPDEYEEMKRSNPWHIGKRSNPWHVGKRSSAMHFFKRDDGEGDFEYEEELKRSSPWHVGKRSNPWHVGKRSSAMHFF